MDITSRLEEKKKKSVLREDKEESVLRMASLCICETIFIMIRVLSEVVPVTL